MKPTPTLKLEQRIGSGERGAVMDRWRYGRAVLAKKAGRERLPHGLIDALIAEAKDVDPKSVLSEREIQFRIRFAEAYDTEAIAERAVRLFGSWSALRDAGFPPVEPDGSDPDDLEAEELAPVPDEWEQLQLEIPGLHQELKLRGRTVQLARGVGSAVVADVGSYLAMCEEKHENYGKTVDRIRESYSTMLAGCGGDLSANAVEAWEAGLSADVASPPAWVEQCHPAELHNEPTGAAS